MKTPAFAALAALALSVEVADAEEIPTNVATSMKSYTIKELQDAIGLMEADQFIKLKFGFRGGVEKDSDGSATAYLQSRREKVKGIWEIGPYIAVSVPPEGLEWVKRITTDETSRANFIVIARVRKTGTIEIVGREIKTDAKGSRAVW